MSAKKRPSLSLSSPDATDFLAGGNATPKSVPKPTPVVEAPKPPPVVSVEGVPAIPRGCVIQASGKVKRRLVAHCPVEIGDELDQLCEETGASLSWHVSRLLALALNQTRGA